MRTQSFAVANSSLLRLRREGSNNIYVKELLSLCGWGLDECGPEFIRWQAFRTSWHATRSVINFATPGPYL